MADKPLLNQKELSKIFGLPIINDDSSKIPKISDIQSVLNKGYDDAMKIQLYCIDQKITDIQQINKTVLDKICPPKPKPKPKPLICNDDDSKEIVTERELCWKELESIKEKYFLMKNKFFFSYTTPGIEAKIGDWTNEEHASFMKRAKEVGVNQQWGIFSKPIPGRTGKQCSNYWRWLIKEEMVTDPNYKYNTERRGITLANENTSDQFKRFSFIVNKDPSGTLEAGWTHPKNPSNNNNNNNNNSDDDNKKRKLNKNNIDEEPKSKKMKLN